jgi:hypothetical protein
MWREHDERSEKSRPAQTIQPPNGGFRTLGHPFAGANHSAHALSPSKGACQEPAVEHAQHEADRAREHDADQFNETILALRGVWTETKPSS